MRALVCLRAVPDPRARLRVTRDGRLDTDGLRFVLDPRSEEAIETARALGADEILATGIGPNPPEEALLAARARGAHRSVWILDDDTSAEIVAARLAALAQREAVDLLLGGTGETTGRLARALGWAEFVGHSLSPAEGAVRVVSPVRADRRRDTVTAALPLVVGLQPAERPAPALPLAAIQAAARQATETIPGERLGPAPTPGRRLLGYEPPPPRGPCRFLDSVEALAQILGAPVQPPQTPGAVREYAFDGRLIAVYDRPRARLPERACPLLARASEPAPRPALAAARHVVAGGRALRDAQSFERLVGGLADALGGAVAASGGAVAAGLAPNAALIGQSGSRVAPEQYIALGISGTDQHVAGFLGARRVVAVNSDPEAPLFAAADYGLVGDLFKIVPSLTERFALRGETP